MAKVGQDGRWLKSWGSYGRRAGQFDTLHSIAADADDRIYVADRGNRRIQVFDTEGKLAQDHHRSTCPRRRRASRAIGNQASPGPTASRRGQPDHDAGRAPGPVHHAQGGRERPAPLRRRRLAAARIYKLNLDGQVLGWLGGSGKQLKQFGWIHEIACPTRERASTSASC